MNKKKAQSLLELAIFGSILVSLCLAVLISYGLKNTFQQQIMQQTFRKALAETQKRPGNNNNRPRFGQASYLYMRDRHTTNPSAPFGIGSVSPTVYSASVQRDFRMTETADTEDELPRLSIEIEGARCPGGTRLHPDPSTYAPPCYYLTAGFAEKCVPEVCGEGQMDKYEEIYGATNVWEVKQGGNTVSCTTTSGAAGVVVKVIDQCEGEIMSYDSCKKQCKMFTNQDNTCVEECKLGRLDSTAAATTCANICDETVEVPWYCSEIENLFSFTASEDLKSMGTQQDYTQVTNVDNLLAKDETPARVRTTDTFNYTDLTTRTIVLINNRGTVSQQVTSEKKIDEEVIWESPW